MDEFGRSSLHNACIGLGYSRSESIATINKAAASGSDIDATDFGGWTALHFASQNSDAELCELLLKAGAMVDPVETYGNTPLWRAVMNCRGDGDCIKVLRSYGADPYLENKSGISPLSLARSIGNYDVAQHFADLR